MLETSRVKVRTGQPIPVQPHKRLHDHVMDSAMGDVIDALVELITNADDSYGRLARQGKRSKEHGSILIERFEQRTQPSYLIVRDKAEGMTLDRMVEVLREPGKRTSSVGDRGYMGRGAKDCAKFGDISFESIHEGRHYKCTLKKRATKIIPEINGNKASRKLRKSLGLPHGNGTTVRLEIGQEFQFPRLGTLSELLTGHYALQDILAEKINPEVLIRNGLRPSEKPHKLVGRQPEAATICENEVFDIPGYGVQGTLSIYRADSPFDEKQARTRAYGFLITGRKAIHERSLLDSSIETDPNSRRYFGRIECHAIDDLLEEYEELRDLGQDVTAENPRLLLDPSRRFGLEKAHPFTKCLLEYPIQRLRKLLEEDRAREKKDRTDLGNRETRQRLDRLAKAASRFLKKQVDDLDQLGIGEDVDEDSFVREGLLLYPTFLNVTVGVERRMTLYVNRAAVTDSSAPVIIETDAPESLAVIGSSHMLRPHRKKEDRLVCSFTVKGLSEAEDVTISARCTDLPIAEALAQVVIPKVEDRTFQVPLEFERDEYRVHGGSEKTIMVYGETSELGTDEVEVNLYSDVSEIAGIQSKCSLVPKAGTNFSEGQVRIYGRRLKAHTTIHARIGDLEATAKVSVTEKSAGPDGGPRVIIKLKDEDFGNFRAIWADHEGRPNELRVAGRHESIARYLGPAKADGTFPGEDSPIYRVLLAEIVAEAVCRKSLQAEARERP